MQTQRQPLHHSHTRATVDPPGLRPGTLYEGNFEEWFANISAALKRHGANIADVFAPKNQGRQWAFALQTGTDIKTFFTSDINPRIWQRVPKALLGNQRDTLTALRNVASPFRLMDLPPELRSKVFEFSIGGCSCADAENLYFQRWHGWSCSAGIGDSRLMFSVKCCKRCIQLTYHLAKTTFLPPLTRTSRQLRVETLSLAWSTIDLFFFGNNSPDCVRDIAFYRTSLPMIGFEFLQRVTLVIVPLVVISGRVEVSGSEKLLIRLHYHNEKKSPDMAITIEGRSLLKLDEASQKTLDTLFHEAVTRTNSVEQSSSDAILSVLTIMLVYDAEVWDYMALEPLEQE